MAEDDKALSVVSAARDWLGTPYRHQASLKGVGADCLGLVRGVWRSLIGPEPAPVEPYSRDWAEVRDAERLRNAARRYLIEKDLFQAAPGDVVLFRWRRGRPGKHLGILTEGERFIHAYEHAGVVESPLSSWWRQRMVHAFAFPLSDMLTSQSINQQEP